MKKSGGGASSASKGRPSLGLLGSVGRASIVWAADADNGLSCSKMEHVVSSRHPRYIRPDGKRAAHSCCGAKTGWHCSCKNWRNSEIREMGVGISVYFKFLKFMMILFLWFTFLSIPAYVLFLTGNQSGVQEINVKWALSAPTLGNIGQCKY